MGNDVKEKGTDLAPQDDKEESLHEILEEIPEEHRKILRKMTSIQMGGVFSPQNAISEKITPEHITQFLDGSKVEMEHRYEEKKQRKIFLGLMALLVMGVLIAIIVILKDTPDIMEKIIYAVGGLIAGAFGGYGIGKNNQDDE